LSAAVPTIMDKQLWFSTQIDLVQYAISDEIALLIEKCNQAYFWYLVQ